MLAYLLRRTSPSIAPIYEHRDAGDRPGARRDGRFAVYVAYLMPRRGPAPSLSRRREAEASDGVDAEAEASAEA